MWRVRRPATGWPERVAPLGQGGTVARQRAVRRLLSGTRVTVRPWPGGGWQLAVRAAGWRLTGAAGSAAVTVARCDGEGLTVEAPQGARSLAAHLDAHLSELSVPPPGSR